MNIEITTEQAAIFESLLIQNRDNSRLQNITKCNYTESINLLNEIRKKVMLETFKERKDF